MEIIRTETLKDSEWIKFKQKVYLDRLKQSRTWTFVERKDNQQAAFIVALDPLRKQILVIRQFRITLEKYVVEFPAGLIDLGENVAETARRELLEETGYSGEIEEISSALAMSAGITNETAYLVKMRVDLDPCKRQLPKLESVEDIETFMVELAHLKSFIHEREKNGDIIDGKLYCFASALLFS